MQADKLVLACKTKENITYLLPTLTLLPEKQWNGY